MDSIVWGNGELSLLDQSKLPLKIEYVKCASHHEVARAIKSMIVRGAPAIGVGAAYGMVLAAREYKNLNKELFLKKLFAAGDDLKSTRPTAVNLFWAVDKIYEAAENNIKEAIEDIIIILEKEAIKIHEEDILLNKEIGKWGVGIVPDDAIILTHCNAGALATAGYGTALGVIRTAHERRKLKKVYACETRPLLQGARLTAWELNRDKIPVTLITDSMAGYLMGQGKVDVIIVGADRIALNGDTANKIGTYSLAVLASYHKIPFYIAAPYSTIDFNIKSGNEIIVEERDASEIRTIKTIEVIPENIMVFNPAFDITPNALISGIITDKGIITAPYEENLTNTFIR